MRGDLSAVPMPAQTFMNKDPACVAFPASPAAIHVSGRFAFNTLAFTAFNTLYEIGMQTTTSPQALAAILVSPASPGTAPVFQMVTGNVALAASFTMLPGSTPVINTFFTFDLIIVKGNFVAGWINTDGPYISTTDLPDQPAPPVMQCNWDTTGAGTLILYVDWYELAYVGAVVNPVSRAGITN